MKQISAAQRLAVHALFVSLLVSCVPPTAQQTVSIIKFKEQITLTINQSLTNSEAEVYLTHLTALSDAEIWQFSDRICESIRRGTSVQTLTDFLQTHNFNDMPYPQIAIVSEQQRCPENSLPQAEWQRSLFQAWEHLNGGTPIDMQ